MDPSDHPSGSVAEPFDISQPESIVGRVVDGRFRLDGLTADGSTTVMFDATDMATDAAVMLKFIRPEICALPGFLGRFEQSQRAVSGLDHPNLATTHAWGVVEGRSGPGGGRMAFVVSERLSGGSLRDMYDRQRRLSPSQALALGLDVCRGLDHAHRNGFVHGELSPGKLVFGADRRVRIVDLGISELMIEHLWADPSKLPTHTAEYAAPEQARGGPAVAASDVYALALVLIEGVTGELPFVGDSTLATLEARVDRLMPVSADLGPLAAVLERAGRPEPEERSTAARFGRDLMGCAEKLPRPEPLDLTGEGLFAAAAAVPDSDPAVDQPVLDDTELDVTVPDVTVPDDTVPDVTVPDVTVPGDAVLDDPVLDESMPVDPLLAGAPVGESSPVDEHPDDVVGPSPEPLPAPVVAPTEVIDEPVIIRERRRLPNWVTRGLFPVLIVAALAVLVVVAARLFVNPSYAVPDLTGLEQAEAEAEIAEYAWAVEITRDRSDDEPRPGHVIRTVPGVGERLSRGEPFLLVISEGPEFRRFPDLVGRTEAEAIAVLDDLRLIPDIREDFDEEIAEGAIARAFVAADPSLTVGDDILPDTEVIVVVSLGPAPRIIPELIGVSEAEATAILTELGLQVVVAEPVFSDDAPPGTIGLVDPAPGTSVSRGSTVTIAPSLGPDLAIFPDLAGTNFAEAQARLAAVGLEAKLSFGSSDDAARFRSATIDGRGVRAGETVRRQSVVSLVFF